jgi:hypothetical protein
MLGPESLAVFQPLTHEPPRLVLSDLSETEACPGFGYEGKNIVDVENPDLIAFDVDLRTRNLSILALIAGLSLGLFSLVFGTRIITSGKVLLPKFLIGKFIGIGNLTYPFPAVKTTKNYFTGHRVYIMPQAAVLSASLALNVCLTVLFDSMSHVQTCTLRWALWREGRLQFNSNPRLFTSAHRFSPNSWYMNVISCMALIIGYSSTSILTSSVHMIGFSDPRGHLVTPANSQGWALDINGWCLAGLGVALLLQGLICSWCLARSHHVPTWSSNPLNTARVCASIAIDYSSIARVESDLSNADYRSQKQLFSPFTSHPSSPIPHESSRLHSTPGACLAMPLTRQQPMRALVSRSKYLTGIIWAVFSVVAIWTIVVGAVGKQNGTCTAAYVRITVPHTFDFLHVWQNYCRISAKLWLDAYTNRRDWLSLIIHCASLSIISLGLHCAEVLTEMTRDEAIWRKAATNGADPKLGSIMQAALSWQCWLLFVFKCVVPWIFGYALETSIDVFMSLLPLLTLAILFLLLGLLAEFLVRHKPKGPQPATYGNIEAIAALVDEWQTGKIFWGDKGAVTETVRRAGTSGKRLADLQMSYLYMGLRG